MPKSFNIVPEIAGVDTSDPSRFYSCEEQSAVIKEVLGGVKLPKLDDSALYIGRRRQGKGYSSTAGRIYVANDGGGRRLLTHLDPEDKSGGAYGGFLAVATKAALNAGRKAQEDELFGEKDRTAKIGPKLNDHLYNLTDYLLIGASNPQDFSGVDRNAFENAIKRSMSGSGPEDAVAHYLVHLERLCAVSPGLLEGLFTHIENRDIIKAAIKRRVRFAERVGDALRLKAFGLEPIKFEVFD